MARIFALCFEGILCGRWLKGLLPSYASILSNIVDWTERNSGMTSGWFFLRIHSGLDVFKLLARFHCV